MNNLEDQLMPMISEAVVKRLEELFPDKCPDLTFHEAAEDLSDETKDMHRAIVSLMEELEAVDWYNQRVDACKDPALKKILEHNRDEEKEHAAMMLEWIRRQDPTMDKELRDSLFTDGEIGHHD